MQEQLSSEETRKLSLEQRGLAVITSSGVLATLAFGALALAKRGDSVRLPGAAAPLIVGGASALLLAAVLALVTNLPMRHPAAAPAAMLQMMRDRWSDDESRARARVTATRAGLLVGLRRANHRRSMFLLAGLTSEVAGAAALAGAVCVVLLGLK
ncbi:hypothetical protein [Cryptosporangium arvum]|uniref:hypothetical protein n=1 Tax=Cryptosporangium arvum TaxID=80871 RepID=UPI0012EE04A8|nr:hypothetical protein [Cryptosporangium arvum]